MNLVGKHFGRLEVLEKAYTKNRAVYWKCRCECGNITYVSTAKLNSGHTRSCGCLHSPKPYLKDLVGKRFGKLVVVEYDHSNHGAYWKCDCDCGKKDIVLPSYRLLNGSVKSCGCLRKDLAAQKRNNLEGQRFGKLLVLEYVQDQTKWKCQCDCGNITYVTAGALVGGRTKSCGCIPKRKIEDITGKKFNYLTVIRLAYKKDNKFYYECQCDCGEKTIVERSKLGITQSCGHIDISHCGSKNENEILSFMYSFLDRDEILLHSKVLDGKEIDIYVPKLKLGIEYNGSAFHASENGVFSNKDKYYHKNKFLLAKERGINLITVFDKDYEEHKEYILDLIKNYDKLLFLPHNEIEYTNNDFGNGLWMQKFGYEEIGQTEPESFIFERGRLVYRCGKTIWFLRRNV